MTDNEDWRRRKAEELARAGTGPWLSRQPRPAGAGAASAPAQGSVADTTPAPIRKLSDIPDDAIHLDRRRAHSGTHAMASKSAPTSTSPSSARNRWGKRATGMLALVAGLALALAFGWWLRGAAAPLDTPLVASAKRAPSSVAAAPAGGPEPIPEDASPAADAGPETMVDVIPEPAGAPTPAATTPPAPEYVPATVPTPPTTSPASAPLARTERSPSAAEYRAEDSGGVRVTASEQAAVRLDRLSEPRPSALRGRFTAPRAVAAPGQDFSPSFDCRRATSWVNRMVCNDETLAALDVRMSDTYGDAIETAGSAGESRIDADQARFLGQRARCRTRACVDRVYRIRIDELATAN